MRGALKTITLAAILLGALAGAALGQQMLWVVLDRAPMRAERSGLSAVLTELPFGAQVSLVRSAGAWALVREPTGLDAWMYQGHLSSTPTLGHAATLPRLAELYATPAKSFILAEAVDTARSTRSAGSATAGPWGAQPGAEEQRAALRLVLEMPLSPEQLDDFLREGGIGEYAHVASHGQGGLAMFIQPEAVVDTGGEEERQFGLNMAVLAMRDVGRPAFGNQLQRYVNLVGLSVARYAPGNALPFRYVVLESATPHAFALPGGLVMLSTGLLNILDNEAQLALILARETAQASLGSPWAQAKATRFFRTGGRVTAEGVRSPLFRAALDEVLSSALNQGNNARMEEQIDAAALNMAYRAGYDPQQLTAVLQRLDAAASTMQPSLTGRLAAIRSNLARLPLQDGLALATERFRASR